jgi:hypothetical protein
VHRCSCLHLFDMTPKILSTRYPTKSLAREMTKPRKSQWSADVLALLQTRQPDTTWKVWLKSNLMELLELKELPSPLPQCISMWLVKPSDEKLLTDAATEAYRIAKNHPPVQSYQFKYIKKAVEVEEMSRQDIQDAAAW